VAFRLSMVDNDLRRVPMSARLAVRAVATEYGLPEASEMSPVEPSATVAPSTLPTDPKICGAATAQKRFLYSH
jgi:hypothetical protein